MGSANSDGSVTVDEVMGALERCYDPCCEDRGLSVVDMGLIHEVRVERERVEIDMVLTTGWCPSVSNLNGMMTHEVSQLPGVDEVHVEVVWDPAWTPDRMSSRAKDSLSMPLETLIPIRNARIERERRATT